MKSMFCFSRGPKGALPLIASLAILFFLVAGATYAQAPPVPPTFQSISSSLNTYLTNFNATLSALPPSQTPTLFTGNLKNADSNAGPQLVNATAMPAIQLQLQELKAIGVQAVLVECGFPMLYEPFLTSQGQTQAQWAGFYQQVASMVHAAGLKLVVENDTLLVNDVQAGWDAAPFYATLNWTQYQQARAQTALTIAQTMQPDYLVLLQEPQTEYDNSLQTELNTPSGSYAMLSQLIAAVQQAGVPGMQIGAGTGTGQTNALSFIQQYVTLPLNFIDFHIYPVNGGNLPIALQIVNTAAAAGMPVAMTEYWLWKVADNELGVLSDGDIRARNPFNFWEPLDAYFIQTMENLAHHSRMIFQNPFDSESFAAYLPYNSSTESLSDSAILSQESSQASQDLNQAIYTPTAMAYYTSLVAPPDTTPPTVPTGLTGGSANPTTDTLNWVASTDNVGVAGYNVLRNGVLAGTTASTNYQDSGLTEATTYTYTVEAFDLAGNTSAPSLPANVTTADTTPPTAPAAITAAAASCQRVTVTWSPSTDNTGVGSYLVFMGTSPAALMQVGRTSASNTTYNVSPLSCGTAYYFGVEAVDTSGNVSAMSPIASVTTPMPPQAPTGVAAAAASTGTVNVTWSTAVSGGLPIQNYHVYRGSSPGNLAQVAIVLQTSYKDNAVSPSSTYYYAIEAADSGADSSGMSAVVSATTPAPPAAPANFAATPGSTTSVGLTWSAAVSGGLPIQNYHVYRGTASSNLAQLAVTTQTSYTDRTANPSTTYYYAVQAADTGSDLSPMSTVLQATTPAAPSALANVTVTPASDAKVSLTWSVAASGGLPIQNYRVYRGSTSSNLAQVATVLQASYNDTTVTAGATYYYAVMAADSGGDLSPMSAIVHVAVPSAPGVPTGLAATPISTGKIGLAWSTSESGGLPIQNYRVYRGATSSNLAQVATVLQASYNDTTVTAGATYYYAVMAADSGGDLSPMSAIVHVAVPSAPGVPTGLAATPISTGKIGLAWSASVTGGLPIQNYHVYRGTTSSNLAQLAVVLQITYNDTSVTAGTTYYYAVAAADSGGDQSPMSTTVKVVVPSAPGAPTGLAATPISTLKIGLAWSASVSGGLPIQNYQVFRGLTAASMSQVATVGQPSYTDASASPSTTYFYAVQAADTGGDLSAMSATVSATALALPSAPTNVAATAPNKSQVSLSWATAQSGMPLASYTIFRGSSPSALTSLKVVAATQTSTNDSTVSQDATYYYGIQSKDTLGNVSPMSVVVSVTTP